ncbi:MAG TPA: NADH:ubiquinone reductase (Na(+)-transporting) subunit C [Kiritimatiellia bacterium]|nr:NADH:ubiquinone reductase (Na(+)-transporting) subunit C [Kiritimatiellia bacterium]
MSMPKGDGYIIGFAAVICVACSLVLSVTASTLKSRQDYNIELDRKLNILKAFGVETRDAKGKAISGAEVDRIFAESIREVYLDAATGQPVEGTPAGAVLPLYTFAQNGEVVKYAFPVSGKGLWSTIYGYLALDQSLATISGVTFYRHGETPGLGGEVEKDWFQKNFKGKRIWADGKLVPFEVVKGSVADKYPQGNDHAVDGISGATITGRGVMDFINSDLEKYEKYFSLIRRS